MTPDQWHKVKSIVQDALELAPAERADFLAESCANDLIRNEAAALLRAEASIGDFIEIPPAIENLSSARTLQPSGNGKGSKIGRYTVESLIGEGGMGEVYLAVDDRLKRNVAVKVLPANLSLDEERLRRFEREAQAASALNHPNIITIYEIGESAGLSFIVTEYIEGETLSSRLRRGTLALDDVLSIATQMSSALQAAHQAGIVHRDIKPDNIMIRPDGLVKILDFGIAKLTDQCSFAPSEANSAKKPQTNPGTVIGTASYMSPEQARGLDVDPRTDIWSFGVVLYEMVGGRPPFKGQTLTDTIIAIIEKDPPPLENVTSRRIPGRLRSLIEKALRKEPRDRFQSTGEILVDLEALRNGIENGQSVSAAMFHDMRPTAEPTEVLVNRSTEKRGPGRNWFSNANRSIALAVLLISAGALYLGYKFYFGSQPTAINSLAVLPLRSLGSEPDHLGLGLADAVIRRISQTGKVVVRPTNAVRRFATEEIESLEAARQLNVEAVLDGTFQRSGDRLRVSVELTRAADGALLWADSFDMSAADIFAIQDVVARQVASRLQLQLDPAQQARLAKQSTTNPVAYEHYVRGIANLDLRRFVAEARPGLQMTIGLFESAVAADPAFALARAQLAYSYAFMGIFFDPDGPWIDRAREQIAEAERLDANLAETHMARSLILFSAFEGFQIEEAIRELHRAQTINPNIGHDELGNLYTHIGLEDLAENELRRSLEIDPTSEYVKNTIVGSYRIVKLFEKWDEFNTVLLNGRTKPTSWIYISQGRIDEAEALWAEESAKSPDDPVTLGRKALILALKKDFDAAEREVLNALEKIPQRNLAYHHFTYDIACVYALAGRADESLKWLRETVDTGFPSYPLFQRDPFLDPIRDTPAFRAFMEEMRSRSERYRNEFAAL